MTFIKTWTTGTADLDEFTADEIAPWLDTTRGVIAHVETLVSRWINDETA